MRVEKIIDINQLSYQPVGANEDILKDVSLGINQGDFILLLGPSGCGKSMLTHCMNGLIPNLEEGEMRGDVIVGGKNTKTSKICEFAPIIGMVFQNPDDQILSLKVVDEVAWGVENMGLPHDEIVRRVEEFMAITEISHLKERLTFAISGGQKQKVSIASNLAMCQDVLILDDPTTDLDPVCKAEVVSLLARLYKEQGKTFIVIEHELNDLIELSNRLVIMDSGRVVLDGSPGELMAQHYDDMVRLGTNMPQHVEIAHAVLEGSHHIERYPTKKEEAFEILRDFVRQHPLPAVENPSQTKACGDPVVSVRDLRFSYDPQRPILKGLNFDICQGELVAIVGANGSGKSTLINNLVGLLHPDSGKVLVEGKDTTKVKISELAKNIGYVFQNPDHQLFTNTVATEVGFSLKIHDVPKDEMDRRVAETLKIVGLENCGDRHPFSLSRGQRQKLAVATALIHQPRIMLLDEPTTGQDRKSLSGLLNMMSSLNKQGNTTIIVTHDMDVVAAFATRVIVISEGQIVMDGRPEDIFYDRFDALQDLRLRPPTVVDFCRRLQEYGVPRFLIVEELVRYIQEMQAHKSEVFQVA